METCVTTDQLVAFTLGELDDDHLDAVASHLETCVSCARRAEGLEGRTDPLVEGLRAARTATHSIGDAGDPDYVGPPAGRLVDDYELLEEIGRGGMGVVYRARHVGLERIVALKMLLWGEFLDANARGRFLQESRAIARLQHPHVVQVYDVGEYRSDSGSTSPYFVMEFVSGGSLHARLAGRPQPAESAAAWVESLARAAHYAHERGIVHRDLKPANVLLADNGAPKIADFGVARWTGNPLSRQTTGVVGTPEYMAPEQVAGGGEARPAIDVYGLGAILYELLVGRPPFRAANPLDTLAHVQRDEPTPPRRLQPKTPRDLETICLKCLEKSPAARYASAADLAEDLRRFLTNEPILARPTGVWRRTRKWARRRPALAALCLVCLLVACVGFPGALWLWQTAEFERQAADVERDDAARSLYHSLITAAARAWRDNKLAAADELLERCRPKPGRPDFRDWEWHYLRSLVRGGDAVPRAHRGWVYALAFAPDGKSLASGAGTPIFNQYTGEEPGEHFTWEFDALGRQSLAEEGSRSKSVLSLDRSPDGAYAASITGNPFRGPWELSLFGADKKQAIFTRPVDSRVNLLFGPRPGQLFLWGNQSQAIDVATGEPKWQFDKSLVAVDWSPDGSQIALYEASGVVRLHDAATGQPQGEGRMFPAFDGLTIFSCQPALSLAANLVAYPAANRELIILADLSTGEVKHVLRGHAGETLCLCFSPDGRRLATGGADALVRVWDVASGREQFVLRGHSDRLLRLRFSPAGNWLASGGWDGMALAWNFERRADYVATTPFGSGVFAEDLTFSDDSESLRVALMPGGIIEDWSCAGQLSGRRDFAFDAALGAPARRVAFSDDGRRVVCAQGKELPDRLQLWDVAEQSLVHTFGPMEGAIRFSAIDGRGSVVAATSSVRGTANSPASGSHLAVWSADGRRLIERRFVGEEAAALALSHDGASLAVAVNHPDSSAGRIEIWSVPDGARRIVLDVSSARVLALAWCDRTGRLAAALDRGRIIVWERENWREIAQMSSHPELGDLAFSPDGRRLAGATRDETTLWDPVAGVEVLSLSCQPRGGGDLPFNPRVRFSRDGTRLAVGQRDGGVAIWTAPEAAE